MSIGDIGEALSRFSCIPSIKSLYDESCMNDAINILEETAGILKDGTTAYRVYSAAAMWLEQNPELYFIKKHDRTEMGNPSTVIAALRRRQALYDKNNGVIAPEEGWAIAHDDYSQTISFLPNRL
ncbi:MAG: hypothetical protein ACREPR_13550 [Brasilonema sp.]